MYSAVKLLCKSAWWRLLDWHTATEYLLPTSVWHVQELILRVPHFNTYICDVYYFWNGVNKKLCWFDFAPLFWGPLFISKHSDWLSTDQLTRWLMPLGESISSSCVEPCWSPSSVQSCMSNRCLGYSQPETRSLTHISPSLTSVRVGTDLVTPSGLQQPLGAESQKAAVKPDRWLALVGHSMEGWSQVLAKIEKWDFVNVNQALTLQARSVSEPTEETRVEEHMVDQVTSDIIQSADRWTKQTSWSMDFADLPL